MIRPLTIKLSVVSRMLIGSSLELYLFLSWRLHFVLAYPARATCQWRAWTSKSGHHQGWNGWHASAASCIHTGRHTNRKTCIYSNRENRRACWIRQMTHLIYHSVLTVAKQKYTPYSSAGGGGRSLAHHCTVLEGKLKTHDHNFELSAETDRSLLHFSIYLGCTYVGIKNTRALYYIPTK